jgi:uncharacterized membrane protein YcaP (DUF421 family)
MEWLYQVDWRDLFIPSLSLAEIFIRGTVIYLVVFFLLRVVPKREAGSISIADLLVVVLIASAVERSLAGGSTAITDGLLLVVTIVLWDTILGKLALKVQGFSRFVHPPPVKLVEKGKVLYKNMRREFVTQEELMSHVREKGLSSVEDIKEAYMEGDGRISVIGYEQTPASGDERDHRG